MRFRDMVLILSGIILYGLLAYGAIYYIPAVVPEPKEVLSLPDASTKAQLLVTSETSIRSNAVTIVTGSALGAVGLAAFLTFGAGRRDAERNVRKSQDDLFTKALDMIGNEDGPIVTGAISLLGSVAHSRDDLRMATASALFTVVRQRLRVSNPIACSAENRCVDILADRDSLAASALRVLGNVSGRYVDGKAGVVVERRLDGCDLRRWEITNARYEVVTFSGSYFWDASFIDCDFVKCVFAQADWTGASFRRVRFVECDLSLTNLDSADGFEVEVRKCIGIDFSTIPEWVIFRE